MSRQQILDSQVSFYKNHSNTAGEIRSLLGLCEDIKHGKWDRDILAMRQEMEGVTDEKERDRIKKIHKAKLSAFTGSGVFSKRNAEGLIKHSGVLFIDIDPKENPILLEKFDEILKQLTADKYTCILFSSSSGMGIAIGVKIDGTKHLETFQFLQHYYLEKHGLTIDKGCKDVTRLRYISYDPDLYLNEGAETVIVPPDFSKEPKCSHTPVSHANHEVMQSIIKNGKLLGNDTYESWLKIGFALANEFGETGRGYFHELSKISPKYDPVDCDRKFNNCLKTNRGDVTFGTIVHMAREAGVNLIPQWPQSKEETASLPLVNQPKAKYFHWSDVGNAEILVAQHGTIIRYCYGWKKWLVWDGKTWYIDNNGQILRLAKDTAKHIYKEAFLIADDERRKKAIKWALISEDEGALKSMVSLAQSEPGVPISPDQLDANPYLLNCLNGTIDLKTGELKPHDPKDFITKIIPVEYRPKAMCPRWLEFLETIFNWNYDIIQFVQRAIGYSLTGDTSEQCLFLPYGLGENGKSTFIDAVQTLLGDYAQTADFETFLSKKNDGGIRNDIARMQGRRFISAIETEGERRLAEALVKQLTGGDTISARFLYGEFFDFKPQFKLWLACNHKPNIKGTDHAIWRRIKLIPFNVKIPEDKRLLKSKVMEMFTKEFPGILAWAVQGCLEWQKNGLQTPDEVKAATNGYRDEMDIIGTFLAECCILTPEVKSKAGDLYETYKKWCEQNGEYAVSQRSFGLRLAERGLERVKSSGNFWKGIGLKS